MCKILLFKIYAINGCIIAYPRNDTPYHKWYADLKVCTWCVPRSINCICTYMQHCTVPKVMVLLYFCTVLWVSKHNEHKLYLFGYPDDKIITHEH